MMTIFGGINEKIENFLLFKVSTENFLLNMPFLHLTQIDSIYGTLFMHPI